MRKRRQDVYRGRPHEHPEGKGWFQGCPSLPLCVRRCQHRGAMTTADQADPLTENWAIRLGLFRRRQRRLVAGVAGGVADRLGVNDGYVRAAFATAATMWGIGVVLYAVIWHLTIDIEDDRPARTIDARQRLGLAVVFVAAVWIMVGAGLVPDGFATAVVATLSFGLAALWDRSDSPTLARIILPGGSGGLSIFRLVGGMVLVLGGLGILFSSVGAVAEIGFSLLAVAVTVTACSSPLGPGYCGWPRIWGGNDANGYARRRGLRWRPIFTTRFCRPWP